MVKGKKRLIFHFFLLLGPIWGWSADYQPWIGSYLEFEWRSSLRFQTYQTLSCGSHVQSYHSDDLFLNTSLSLAVDPDFSLEIEATAAQTRRQSGGIDELRMNGRYVWLDDIAGDPITFTTGASFIQAFEWSLKDKSSFHHGRSEGEIFASVGKEWTQREEWVARWWSMAGIGCAERGSPWIRFNLAYGQRLKSIHQFELFANSLWGLGHQNLDSRHFHGYGSIQHQSIDLGCRYTYLIEFFGSASIEYAKRVHARNFPAQAHQVCLSLFYTFGL